MCIRIAATDDELVRVADVMLQLRPAYTHATLTAQMRQQQADGYRVAYLERDGEIVCVAGFVVGTKLAWGKHIYVDDLVTASAHRSTGAGTRMIDWLVSHARDLGCAQLHLDSGVQRYAAHRFYLRHAFDITSHHFGREIGAA